MTHLFEGLCNHFCHEFHKLDHFCAANSKNSIQTMKEGSSCQKLDVEKDQKQMNLAEKALVFKRGSTEGNSPCLWTGIVQVIWHCKAIRMQNCPFAYGVLLGPITATYYLQLSIVLPKALIVSFCLF